MRHTLRHTFRRADRFGDLRDDLHRRARAAFYRRHRWDDPEVDRYTIG
jgi:hypothetical protein